MPVEIRELVIRAVAVDDRADSEDVGTAARVEGGVSDASERDQIVQDCVKEVLRILRRHRER